jgi:steroid delta-isomerase-like uncharacterized protein
MLVADNKQLVLTQWYEQLWDKRMIHLADALFTPDYALHLSGSPAPLNRDALKQFIGMCSDAFPDLSHNVDEIISEGNIVAARWTFHGTFRADFQGIPPTGKAISFSGITVHHLKGGQISETWLTMDMHELLQKLGAISG